MSKPTQITLGNTEIISAYVGVNRVYTSAVDLAELFAAGAQGFWYDLTDLSTLFQNEAGTIPVTGHNQPVGRLVDKSGNGMTLTQPTSGARPLYKTDGAGPRLYFDGVDDSLRILSITPPNSNNMHIFTKFRPDVSQASTDMFAKKLSLISYLYIDGSFMSAFALNASSLKANNMAFTVSVKSFGATSTVDTQQAGVMSTTAPTRCTISLGSMTEEILLNSVLVPYTKSQPYDLAPQNWYIPAGNVKSNLYLGNSAFINHKGDIYSTVMVSANLSASQINKLEAQIQ